ncbi:MAG: SDR family NAD(P)-dependent oxidoreductase [Ostreibacterium sp.]
MKPKIFAADKEPQQPRITIDSLAIAHLALKDKQILITGATQGTGKTLSQVAAAAGAQTILLDKSIPALESIYEDIMAIDGVLEPFLLPVDMAGANLDDYLEIAEQLNQEIPHLDGVIHNAAYFAGLYALMQTPPEDLIKQIQVNYTAPIWLTQAIFSLLQQSDSPTLLFADHEESYADNTAYYNTYAGTKLALMQAVKQLALEHQNYNLYAYGYNTGWVNTALARQAFPHAKPNWSQVKDVSLASRVLALFNREEVNGSILGLSTG